MNSLAPIKRPPKLAVLAAAMLLLAAGPRPAAAADAEFVGVLAMAVENDKVAEELGLTDEQKTKLREWVDAREGEALELVYLPEPERADSLAAFRRESETRGFALLSPQQRARLGQIRIREEGLASLAEPEIAGRLRLSEAQRRQVAELLKAREEQRYSADQKTARIVTERELYKMLTEQQRAGWEGLTGSRSTQPAGTVPTAPTGPTGPAEAARDKPTEPREAAEDWPGELMELFDEQPPQPGRTADDRPEKKPERLRFSFHFQPWKEVLIWFADQSDLSLVMDAPPQGTFNYTDNRDYTPAEAIDLLNSVLLTKGYTLVRRDRMLMLIYLDDGIPPNLVSTIPLEDLDKKGEFELVSVLFQVDKVKPEEIEPELQKLIGPQGSVVTLPTARQILVTETAGRLRAIRSVIQRIENPDALLEGQMRTFDLKYAAAEEVTMVARQLLSIGEDENATEDGSLRFAVDAMGDRLLVNGKPEMVARFEEILKAVDVPGPYDRPDEGIVETPQLQVYSVTAADPESVLAVMQTLLAGMPDVRLTIDPKTGNLVALARPSQQATIKATLEELQRDARQIEVIHLRVVDPQLAVLSINKLFGAGGEKPDPSAPQVDADPTSRQLLVRATPVQIEQIRTLLEKMGESDTEGGAMASRGNVRMLPLTGQAAESALQRIQEIWPVMRQNRIRVVTPSAVVPTMQSGERIRAPRLSVPTAPSPRDSGPDRPEEMRPSREGRPPGFGPPERFRPEYRRSYGPGPETRYRPQGGSESFGPSRGPAETPPLGSRSTQRPTGVRVLFASQTLPAEPRPDEPTPAEPTSEPPQPDEPNSEAPAPQQPQPEARAPQEPQPEAPAPQEPQPEAPAPQQPQPEESKQPGAAKEPSPIVVSVGRGGLMIASQDLDALDAFEDLLTSLAGNTMGGGPEMTIFYLKHAKAALVAQTLDQIFGGGTIASESGGGGGGLLNDLTGGGIMGALLGLGGSGGSTIAPSGSIRITPDTRLNALLVQANPTDLDMVEQLLKILDQKESPEEILIVPKAKVIPVFNTQAEVIAENVKELYRDRMVASAGGGGQRPSPEEFVRMLRGGSRGRGSGRSAAEEVQKMSISVDATTNSILVAAPEPLLQEVEQLIKRLDDMALESNDQSIRVVTLHRASSETVQRALTAMMGDSVQFGGGSGGSSRSRTSSSTRTTSSDSRDARRAAFFEMMRQRFGGGGAPGGGGPRGGGPGGGGRSDRGGRPGGDGGRGGGAPRPISPPGR